MSGYGQFCPVAKTADVLCQRWALLVVREMLSGSTRFCEIQRGVPGCPPATLSKRLKELTAAGVIERSESSDGVAYALTDAGLELYPIVEGFGRWGQRWARGSYDADELDVEVLLWDLRRFLDPAGLPVDEAVIQLDIREARKPLRRFWIVVEPWAIDLCLVDPDKPVDAVVAADLRALTRIWMGDLRIEEAIDAGEMTLSGPRSLTRRIPAWIGQHPVLGPIGPAVPA